MPKRFIMTGSMGSGKSTVLKLLKTAEFNVIEEPARQILPNNAALEMKVFLKKILNIFYN